MIILMQPNKPEQQLDIPLSPPGLRGQRITAKSPHGLDQSFFPFLSQSKHLYHQMLAQNLLNSKTTIKGNKTDIIQLNAYSERLLAPKISAGRYATIDSTNIFLTQRGGPRVCKIQFTNESQLLNASKDKSKEKAISTPSPTREQVYPSFREQLSCRLSKIKQKQSGSKDKMANCFRETKLQPLSSKILSPRATRIDFTKKSNGVWNKEMKKYSSKEHFKEQVQKSLNTTNLRLLTNRSHFEQLQRLKMTLYNHKMEEKQKQLRHKASQDRSLNLSSFRETSRSQKNSHHKSPNESPNSSKITFLQRPSMKVEGEEKSFAREQFEPWENSEANQLSLSDCY